MLIVNGQRFLSAPGETILETLERNNQRISVGCRSGFCGLCRCKKVSGRYSSIEEPIASLEDNEILACTSTISNDNDLVINI